MILAFLNSRFFLVFLFPLILGCLTVLSFQPFNFSYINFIIIPALFLVTFYVKKKSKNRFRNKPYLSNLFFIGYFFGVGFFLTGTYWISHSLTFDENFKVFIPFSIICLPLFLGIFFGLGNLIVGPFLSNNFSSILIFASSLGFMDFLRSKILSGFPWNLWVYSWSWFPEILPFTSMLGFLTINLFSIIIYCAPLLLIFGGKKNLSIFFILAVIFTGNFFYGSTVIKKNNEYLTSIKNKPDQKTNIKIVSPNFDLRQNLSSDDISEIILDLIKYSDPEKNKKTLFIWPEGVFSGYNYEDIRLYRSLFLKSFSEDHLILFGTNTEKDNNTFNSLIVTNNNLEILFQYDKQKLVPFGEFLPLEKLLSKFGLKKITEGYGSFSKGKAHDVFQLDDSKILPLICYEIIFPELSRNKIKKNLIINISEDAWFGNSIGPQQHFAKAIFRALESNVFLARSANKGISAFIDNKGVVVKSLNPNEAGTIELNVPIINNNIPEQRINLIFFILLFTHVLIFIILKNKNI